LGGRRIVTTISTRWYDDRLNFTIDVRPDTVWTSPPPQTVRVNFFDRSGFLLTQVTAELIGSLSTVSAKDAYVRLRDAGHAHEAAVEAVGRTVGLLSVTGSVPCPASATRAEATTTLCTRARVAAAESIGVESAAMGR
jgi:hypothetical protein